MSCGRAYDANFSFVFHLLESDQSSSLKQTFHDFAIDSSRMNMSSPDGTTPKKGKRMSFGRLLGSKRDKEPVHSRDHSDTLGPPTGASDSAYASSENEPKGSLSRSDTIPVENTGQFKGVSSDRKLGLNQGTGDVVDSDTGQVVSTVTTTTTTVSHTSSEREVVLTLECVDHNDHHTNRQRWEAIRGSLNIGRRPGKGQYSRDASRLYTTTWRCWQERKHQPTSFTNASAVATTAG